MCLIHKWGPWEQYEVTLPARQITNNYMLSAAIARRQKKICRKCGKEKDELIYAKEVRILTSKDRKDNETENNG